MTQTYREWTVRARSRAGLWTAVCHWQNQGDEAFDAADAEGEVDVGSVERAGLGAAEFLLEWPTVKWYYQRFHSSKSKDVSFDQNNLQ